MNGITVRQSNRSTIPTVLTSLVGRKREIAELEHLLTDCSRLVETLLRSTTIQIMTTSREPLGVMGEILYPMPSLTLPAPDEDFATITQSDAIQLFVERARSIRPGFALTPENATTVAAICRQLDGLPLRLSSLVRASMC